MVEHGDQKSGPDNSNREFVTYSSRTRFGQQYARLGPARTIEALRMIQDAYRNSDSMNKVAIKLIESELIDSELPADTQMTGLLSGYLIDRSQWDNILDSLPKGEENAG